MLSDEFQVQPSLFSCTANIIRSVTANQKPRQPGVALLQANTRSFVQQSHAALRVLRKLRRLSWFSAALRSPPSGPLLAAAQPGLVGSLTRNLHHVAIFLEIGLTSTGEPFAIGLHENERLFFSFSNPDIQVQILTATVQQIAAHISGSSLAICSSSKVLQSVGEDVLKHNAAICMWRSAEGDLSMSRDSFIKQIMNVANDRQRQLSKRPSAPFTPFFVVIDDFIDLLLAKSNVQKQRLVELITGSDNTNMHFLIGSSKSYLSLSRLLFQHKRVEETNDMLAKSIEVVFTSEGFVYVRYLNELNYTRLFEAK